MPMVILNFNHFLFINQKTQELIKVAQRIFFLSISVQTRKHGWQHLYFKTGFQRVLFQKLKLIATRKLKLQGFGFSRQCSWPLSLHWWVVKNVNFVFLPPNTTSVIQPIDQGVISTFKSYYLRRTFQLLISETDGQDKPTMLEFLKKFNLKPSWMNGVWR